MPAAELYGHSLALLTDLYQLTMAHGYWKTGCQEHEAVFHLSFRRQPFGGGYSIAAGLEPVADFLRRFRFEAGDIAYLASLTGNDGAPLFESGFLDALAGMELACDVDAVPEGTLVFPHEPLVRVRGPLWQCQLIETPLLNTINFQTLIATRSARVCQAARGDSVLEFGLRRAHGVDGGVSASRAAYIGGCAGTSNVLAGKLHGIPIKGTHAHSWVMAFPSELEAFEAYAEAMPNNCVFLVDTYDTLEGVRHAVTVGKRLRDKGHELGGIRLDSGDLAWLSVEARKILDDGGFPDAVIVASNDLDERIIASLKSQGAAVDVWGVGTKLATAYAEPALGGVYKLSAIRVPGGKWQYKLKLSEQAHKISSPGILQVRRFFRRGEIRGDIVYDEALGLRVPTMAVDPMDATRRKHFDDADDSVDLLKPVFRDGRFVGDRPTLDAIRARTLEQLDSLYDGVKRHEYPHQYPVGLDAGLHELRTRLILEARGEAA